MSSDDRDHPPPNIPHHGRLPNIPHHGRLPNIPHHGRLPTSEDRDLASRRRRSYPHGVPIQHPAHRDDDEVAAIDERSRRDRNDSVLYVVGTGGASAAPRGGRRAT